MNKEEKETLRINYKANNLAYGLAMEGQRAKTITDPVLQYYALKHVDVLSEQLTNLWKGIE